MGKGKGGWAKKGRGGNGKKGERRKGSGLKSKPAGRVVSVINKGGHDLGESEGKDCNGDFLPDSLEIVTLKGRSHTRSALLRERVAQCISTVELTHTVRCAAVNSLG